MKSRHRRTLDAQRIFDRVNYSSMDWPLKTIRLEPDSVEDYNQRTVSPRISVAELYHENSKLFGGMLERLVATHLDPDDVRREFLRRRQASVAGAAGHEHLDRRIGPLMTAVRDNCPAELFYAIELRVSEHGSLSWHEPLSDACFRLRALTREQQRQLGSGAIAHASPPHEGPTIVVVGNLARNDLLYGARGYRRTLLEAGQVAGVVVRQAMQQGCAARACFEFFDRLVDACLECDGTEESALAIIHIDSV